MNPYLSEALEMPINMQVACYESHIERIGCSSSDSTNMGPASYVELHRRYGWYSLLARLKTHEASTKLQQQYGSLEGILEIEITETLLVESLELSEEPINKLRILRAMTSIDDVGTGYSSMAYLKHVPIDALQIDRTFVMNTLHDQDDVSNMQAVIALAKSLSMRVITEGVESREQTRFLRVLGCEGIQGYLISRPIVASEFIDCFSPCR